MRVNLFFVREYIESQDFFKYAHRLIFQAMVDLSDRGDAIDATTVRTILDNQGDLQNIGGLSYLVEIVNSVPTSANAEYYAKIVAEKSNATSFNCQVDRVCQPSLRSVTTS